MKPHLLPLAATPGAVGSFAVMNIRHIFDTGQSRETPETVFYINNAPWTPWLPFPECLPLCAEMAV